MYSVTLGEHHMVDELGHEQIFERRLNLSAVRSRSGLNRDPITAAAQRVCLAAGCKAVDAGGDRRLQRGGHLYLDDVGAADVTPALALDRAALGKLADDLLRKERVTGSPPGDQCN